MVTLDLRALDRVLEVDEASRAALIQAGATGPGLEEQLRPHGLTLRHFPQSFEYSTLGGWIATRAGGHFATGPTHIDDLVESVRALTPRRRVGEPAAARRRAPGRAPTGMLIGSEGILGVITEAWVRVRPTAGLPGLRRRGLPVLRGRGAGGARAGAVGAAPVELPAARPRARRR